jgi:hypothetical protein
MTALPSLRSESLRDTNRRLDSWLESIIAAPDRITITPECMGALLSELLRTGSDLRARPIPPKGTDPAWDEELDAYRQNVERLRGLLPSIHSHLLAERARIEGQRTRIRAAAEWARASRQTL